MGDIQRFVGWWTIFHTDPAGCIKADKVKSTEKIDGVVVTIISLDRTLRNCGFGFSI